MESVVYAINVGNTQVSLCVSNMSVTHGAGHLLVERRSHNITQGMGHSQLPEQKRILLREDWEGERGRGWGEPTVARRSRIPVFAETFPRHFFVLDPEQV